MTTGSWPIIPPISGIDAKNVLLCKNYNQANEINAQAKEAKRVVIVGGGYIGIELVEAFVESGKQVTLIDGLDRILNKYLDKPFTDILEKELTDRGVTLALGENVTEFITDEEGKVKQVATPTDTFDTDMVILCVGFRPNTKLIEGKVETLPNGAIKVNEYMQTSDPDIFAAGDSAVVNYNPSGTQNYIPLATNAVRQGLLVGNNLTEHKMAYRGTQGTSGLYLVNYNPSGTQNYIPLATNAVRQGLLVGNNLTEHKMAYRGTQGTSGLYLVGWTIGSTGVTKESATLNDLEVQATVFEDNYRPEFMPTTEKVMMELVYEKGTNRIVGAQFMSKYDITQSANTMSLAVQNKMTVEDLEKVMMELVYEKGTNRIVGAQFMSKYDITQSANTMSLAVQNKMTVEDLALSDFFFQPHFDRPWNYLNLLAQAALGEIETAQ